MSLVEDGSLSLDTPARKLLGPDLPLIGGDVTVELLLSHRSGIGDYLDEEELDDIAQYVLTLPVHQLATTEGFLPMLEGHPTKFRAGERFSYCNGGYIVLALLAERASGLPFHELVEQRVCARAGMSASGYLRSDELPGGVALGYLDDESVRTNLLHLPVRGNGDGGLYSTVADLRSFWSALVAGRIIDPALVEEMLRPRNDAADEDYGLGFWLWPKRAAILLEGYDAGVSFRSVHQPQSDTTWTVVSNSSEGAWPVARAMPDLVSQLSGSTTS
jgi:CubicO group peptidase (beta-lactamase class C family)